MVDLVWRPCTLLPRVNKSVLLKASGSSCQLVLQHQLRDLIYAEVFYLSVLNYCDIFAKRPTKIVIKIVHVRKLKRFRTFSLELFLN